MRTFIFILISILVQVAQSALIIPSGLTLKDRETALEVLGFGTSPKLLGNPYALGGYSGYEVGISTEIIPTSDISQLGVRSSQQGETSYSLLTFGKGIYNNFDTFVQFGFLGNNESISNVGMQGRWTFFEAEYIPAFLTALISANSVNFQNLIVTNTQALDLVLGVNVDDVTLYLGVGTVRTQGTFVGGASGVTDSGLTMKENMAGSHYLAGINMQFSNAFLAFEIDRYTQSTYSAKVGLRF